MQFDDLNQSLINEQEAIIIILASHNDQPRSRTHSVERAHYFYYYYYKEVGIAKKDILTR